MYEEKQKASSAGLSFDEFLLAAGKSTDGRLGEERAPINLSQRSASPSLLEYTHT